MLVNARKNTKKATPQRIQSKQIRGTRRKYTVFVACIN